jgi:hypothetical protein
MAEERRKAVTSMEGMALHAARRRENEQKAAKQPASDAQGLVEFDCECVRTDCERSVRVPLYVYNRILEADDQCLVQAGHHAFAHYRTIVSFGLMSIEERCS